MTKKTKTTATRPKTRRKPSTAARDKARRKPSPRTPLIRPVCHVGVVLDRSGSMSSCAGPTISGFNEYLVTLQREDKVAYRMSVLQFDSEFIETLKDIPIADVPPLTHETYIPRGSTALHDATGRMIQSLQEKVTGKHEACLVIIITDGYENASQEWTRAQFLDLIKEKERDGQWTFAFIGADMDAIQVGAGIGVQATRSFAYDSTATGAMWQNLSHSNKSYACSMAANYSTTGKAAIDPTEAFFQQDEQDEKDDDKKKGGGPTP